jgi:hypothetical protein
MEKEEEKKPTKVEELKYFPFKTFQEFKKAHTEGVVNIGVDRLIAQEWAGGSIYTSRLLRAQTFFWLLLPFVVFLGFIVYIIVVQNWWLIFALPVLFLSYFIFHPGMAVLMRPIRSGFILLIFGGLIWGLINAISWLTALTFVFTLIWYSQRAMHNKAASELIRMATEHEDLLCLLWHINALNIQFHNGNSYWSLWKDEDGKTIHYDTGNVYDQIKRKR